MKMANVLSISQIIKKEHPYKDYEQLCTYWRDTVRISWLIHGRIA